MIPVNTHLETVKMARQKRVEKLLIKDLDNLVEFDTQLVADVSKSEIPYDMAKSLDIYSFDKSPFHLETEKKKRPVRPGFEAVHYCGNNIPLGLKTGPPTEAIHSWHNYYEKLKAKKETLTKLPSISVRTETDAIAKESETFNELRWDEYALSLVGKNMQEFIVFRLTNKSASDYHRLSRSFVSKHGRPKDLEKIELIDDLFDEHHRVSAHSSRPKWLKQELSRLLPALSSENIYSLKEWPDGRVSAVISKQEIRSFGSKSRPRLIKSTSALDFLKKESKQEQMRTRSVSPPTFAEELVSGSTKHVESFDITPDVKLLTVRSAKQYYSGPSQSIDFSSGRRFVKKLQPVFPRRNSTDDNAVNNDRAKSPTSLPSRAPSRGHRRWIKQPDFIEDGGNFVNRPYVYNDETDDSVILSGRSSARFSAESYSNNLSARDGAQSHLESVENGVMRAQMASDWRNKWRVNLADTTDPNELLQMVADLQPFTRIRGIMTIAYIAHGLHSSHTAIPNYLLKALDAVVADDSDPSVRKAAAICLSSLNRFSHNPAIEATLVDIIRSESSDSADRWTAAQALAHNQVYTSDVISVFLKIYVDNYSPDGTNDPRREVALKLIRMVSTGTALAAGMAGELLSNSDWAVRQSACEVLGVCHGPLPADVVRKLSQLMWEDWSEPVRVAAARALGKTGHGLDVHHELVARIQSKNGAVRARALRLIAIVGFMTVRLMPFFLDCFRDTYTDVREAACSVAARLYKLAVRSKSTLDASVAERLIELMQFDTAPSVRMMAINAIQNCMAALAVVEPTPVQTAAASLSLFRAEPTANQLLREKLFACLVWLMQTAGEADVRRQALLILRENNYFDHEFAEILRQRILAESSEAVRKELEISLDDCLKRFYSSSRQIPLLNDLRQNVRELSKSTNGIVARLDRIDQQARLREFKDKCLVRDRKSSKAKQRPK